MLERAAAALERSGKVRCTRVRLPVHLFCRGAAPIKGDDELDVVLKAVTDSTGE